LCGSGSLSHSAGRNRKQTNHALDRRAAGWQWAGSAVAVALPAVAGALTVTALAARIPAKPKVALLISDELAHRDEALSKLIQNHPAW